MTAEMTEQAVADALARAAMYQLLGAAFAYPTPPGLEELGRLARAVTLPADGPEGLRTALGDFAGIALATDPATLADEYVFLFDRDARCPPWEGAYGEGPQPAGKAASLADIAGFYAAFGLAPSAGQPDAEDHVAAELEFMSVLALKEAYATAEDDRDGLEVTRAASVAFLTDHLGRWAETFAGELGAMTPMAYYTSAAGLLAAWIRSEIARLGATPRTLATPVAREPEDAAAFTCPMTPPAPEAATQA
jgi:TorA maturation chaperone TorD